MKRWPSMQIPYFTTSMLDKIFRPSMTSMEHPFKTMFSVFYTNVSETEEAMSYSFDLPGINQNDLEILQKNRTINIKAQRKDREGAEQFTSSFTVEDRCLIETLNAQLENGVLTISFNKRKQDADTDVKKIEVKSIKSEK